MTIGRNRTRVRHNPIIFGCPRLRLPVAVVVVLALVAGVCTSAAARTLEPDPRSGLTGVVMRGPITPVCREGVPCEAPAKVTLVFSRPGHQAARVHTRADGSYRVRLAPGRYAVQTTERAFERRVEPARVTVLRGRFARADFRIDTGIR